MERLRIRVKSVETISKARLAVARVSATSARKVNGRPVASIELVVTFRAGGVGALTLPILAREAALDFLDVA